LIWGAVAVLAGIAASYLLTDRIAAAAARLSERRGASSRSAASGPGARGWAAMLPYAFGAIVVAAAAAMVIDFSIVRLVGTGLAGNARRILPGQMVMVVVVLSAVGGQAAPFAVRALRALPVGPVVLTGMLQGFMAALVLAPTAVLWLVMRATDLDTSRLPVYLFGMIPLVALRLPVNFRVGVQIGTVAAVLPIVGLIFLPFAPWTRTASFDAAMILAAALILVWTWWELACGRAAYRVQPLGFMRWRGGLN
jgi:hypothetical protein